MLEVEEYIKTPYHNIEKIKKITKEDGWICVTTDKNVYELEWLEKNIVKHSKNIIDLIEVGDYVNGMKIDDIGKIKRFGKSMQKCLWVNIEDGIDIINEEIKDVLTKEQYMQNCYTVERKEEC